MLEGGLGVKLFTHINRNAWCNFIMECSIIAGEKIIKRPLNVRCVLCAVFMCVRVHVCVSLSFDLFAKCPLDINVRYEWRDTNINV